MKQLPDWFPGTGFKRTAHEWGAALREVADRPYEFVKYQLANCRAESSFISQLLENGGDSNAENTLNTKWSALSIYTGGADTVRSLVPLLPFSTFDWRLNV